MDKKRDKSINNDEAKLDTIENIILEENLLKAFDDISSIKNIEQKMIIIKEKKESVNEKKFKNP